MKKPSIVIFLGKPGSGKGTQARMIAEKFGLDYVGSGDLLRDRKKGKDFTGTKISEVVDTGNLMPTAVVFQLWMGEFEKLKNKKDFNGFILDGSPRKMLEVCLLEDALDWYEWKESAKVILIDVSNREVINRLSKRRICQKCKGIIPYIEELKTIKKCPKCGGGLFRRPEDSIEGSKKRLAWFKTDVMPVIRYYQKKGRLIKVNGEQSIENVYKDVIKALKDSK